MERGRSGELLQEETKLGFEMMLTHTRGCAWRIYPIFASRALQRWDITPYPHSHLAGSVITSFLMDKTDVTSRRQS